MEYVERLYAHRHAWPYWDERGRDKVVPLVAQAAVEWFGAYHDDVRDEGVEPRAALRATTLNLGVAAWWGLNQFSDSVYQPEQLDVAGRAADLDQSEDWPADGQPLDAWRRVVARRLSAFFSGAATGFLDDGEEAAFARRQLLFVAYQAEQALAVM